ncbi:MAG TPA: glycogen debranching protein GlgX [Candidatus Binatia bacterium]|nr:glycogen debranching protein GlgX [Candidatus Binatia bacterium]
MTNTGRTQPRGQARIAEGKFEVSAGRPLPLGVSRTRQGLNFSVVAGHATAATLVTFAPQRHDPLAEFPLDPAFHRTGDVWHVAVSGLDDGARYGWRMDCQPPRADRLHRFDPTHMLIDPYARALSGGCDWRRRPPRTGEPAGTRPQRRSMFIEDAFDWQHVRPPRTALQDKIIYEAHVRGLTIHPSSGVAHPGTYRGLIERIPFLKDLGVTTIELLPVYEFDENELERRNPVTGDPLVNVWGYNPICFFAPKAGYASDGRNGHQVAEFKEMVREFHRAGLEVILDVVFNHTAEGRDRCVSLRGLDQCVYYMLDPVTGEDLNYSGCGNTLNCNHPIVRTMIIDALRYWVAEMHVDGFRFDLASILGRGQRGEVLANPPLLERIAFDPVLADATLIAEAWDAAGLYQVGSFPAWGRWAEWNGPFRDDVRRFVRGEPGLAGRLASRLAGSSDLFQASGREPCHSINFVTCHDGFTLADLVSYDRKHNEINGEGNRDGSDHNFSWNCGHEGPTNDRGVTALRARQTRNFLTVLLLSQGTPMLLAGDEFGRTQRGNNNAYCQDNDVTWVDWGLLEQHADLFRFTKNLIAFRRAHSVLRRRDYLSGRGTAGRPRSDVAWHGIRLGQPDWSPSSQALAMHLAGEHAPSPDCDVYFAANNSPADAEFELPSPPQGSRWLRVVDTAQASPDDIAEPGRESRVTQGHYRVKAFSCIVLRSERSDG